MTVAQPDDVTFGDQEAVVILQGKKEFVRHSAPGDPMQIFSAGSLANCDFASLKPESSFGDLFGSFVILIYEANQRRLSIVNDRYGMLPLFVQVTPRSIILSLNLAEFDKRKLVDHVDYHALSDLIAFNVSFRDRTLYDGVRVLPGASKLVVDVDSQSINEFRTWQPADLLQSADVPLRSAENELSDLLLEGFEQATAGCQELGLTLSGGVDSRVLLAIGCHLGKNVHPYSTGIPGSRSLIYAQRMAELCNSHCRLFPLNSEFLGEFRKIVADNLEISEGISFSSEAEGRWLRDHVANHDMMVHGGFAELYKIGHMHSYYPDKHMENFNHSAFAETIWRRFERRFAVRQQALSSTLRDRLRGHARDSLSCRVHEYPAGNGAAGWAQQLYLDEFLGKVTVSSARIWKRKIAICFPFSYPPFVDLLLRIDPKDKWDLDFPYRLLKRLNPQLAAFPDSNTGARIGAPKAAVNFIRILDKIRNRLFADRVGYDHTDAVAWAKALQPPANVMLPQMLGAALGSQDDVDKLCAHAIEHGDISAADSVLQLFTLALWLDRQSKALQADFCAQ